MASPATKKPKTFHGSCLCGAIRFEISGAPDNPHSCSCTLCQRHTGALTTVWVDVPKERLSWVGPGGAPKLYRSSDFSSRAFCPDCGSTLGAVDDGPTIGLMTGVFDKPGAKALIPTRHSYRGKRPKWWHVAVDVAD